MDEDEINEGFEKLARQAGTELAFNLVVSTILEEVCSTLATQGAAYEKFKGMSVALNKIREGLMSEMVS